jgi:hypothetical protein
MLSAVVGVRDLPDRALERVHVARQWFSPAAAVEAWSEDGVVG